MESTNCVLLQSNFLAFTMPWFSWCTAYNAVVDSIFNFIFDIITP